MKKLTVISNNCGAEGFGLWMLNNRQIKRMISPYIGENKLFEQLPIRASWLAGAQPAKHPDKPAEASSTITFTPLMFTR